MVIMQAILKNHFSVFMTCSLVRRSIFPSMNDYCCYPEENNLKNIVIHDSLNNSYYLLFGENKVNSRFATPPPKLKNVNFNV